MDDIIRLVDVDKIFETKIEKVHALKRLNLSVTEGDIFGIIGHSGAGKSTLIRCMNLLEYPTNGHVFYRNHDLTQLTNKELRKVRRSIGMIFQQFHLLMQRNALENVCFPLEISGVSKKEAKKRSEELLQLVGILEKKFSYPAQLSGGQKQRVAIARALATQPDVLLCDEATSALDAITTKSILNLLKSINQDLGITVIIITHELSVVQQICNKVAVLDNGSIIETGTVKEVLEFPESDITKHLISTKEENS